MTDRAEGIAEEMKRLVRQVSDASYTQGADERYDSEIKDRRNDEKVSALLRQSSAAIDRLISIMAERQAGEAVAVPNLDPDGDTSRAGFAAMDAELVARWMSPWQVWREAVRWSTGQRAIHGITKEPKT